MAALGYDSMMLLKDAIVRVGPPTGDMAAWRRAVRDAVASTHDFQGVTGKITIDAQRNAKKPAVVLQIHQADKKATYKTSISPQ
jgi:branched-chain amino acid transport system substrate-binding protein